MSDLRPSLRDGSNRESEDRKPAQAPCQTPGKWPLIALGVAVVAAVAIGGWYWAERWRRREATGDMIMVRYADDRVPRTR
jgi:hypothetical protein